MGPRLRNHLAGCTLLWLAAACTLSEPITQSSVVQMVDLQAQDTIEVYVPHPDDPVFETITANAKPLVDLKVTQNAISTFDPQRLIMFHGQSDLASELAQLEGLYFKTQVPEAVSATFDDDKHYTVVIAWLEPGNEADYVTYLEGIEPAVTRAGGRFLWKLGVADMPRTEANAPRSGQLTFVEWTNTQGFREVQKSDEYAAVNKYFGSAIEKFEFHWLKTASSTR